MPPTAARLPEPIRTTPWRIDCTLAATPRSSTRSSWVWLIAFLPLSSRAEWPSGSSMRRMPTGPGTVPFSPLRMNVLAPGLSVPYLSSPPVAKDS